MNRLTKKENNKHYFNIDNADFRAELNKLGQLEDIEEELSIDLITLFAVLKDGIWYKDSTLIFNQKEVGLYYDKFDEDFKLRALPVDIYDGSWYFKDYGKTWALTKEELE